MFFLKHGVYCIASGTLNLTKPKPSPIHKNSVSCLSQQWCSVYEMLSSVQFSYEYILVQLIVGVTVPVLYMPSTV